LLFLENTSTYCTVHYYFMVLLISLYFHDLIGANVHRHDWTTYQILVLPDWIVRWLNNGILIEFTWSNDILVWEVCIIQQLEKKDITCAAALAINLCSCSWLQSLWCASPWLPSSWWDHYPLLPLNENSWSAVSGISISYLPYWANSLSKEPNEFLHKQILSSRLLSDKT
jgi:hypothetical protein